VTDGSVSVRAVADVPGRWRRSGSFTIISRDESPGKACSAEGLAGFGVRNYPASTGREVNLYRDRPQANGVAVVETVEIAFCPWCGQPVEACRVK
jgi:hypothetical protein